MRVRSPRWGTVSLPNRTVRELVRPCHYFTHEAQPVADDTPF
jgi:hypothetical protein